MVGWLLLEAVIVYVDPDLLPIAIRVDHQLNRRHLHILLVSRYRILSLFDVHVVRLSPRMVLRLGLGRDQSLAFRVRVVGRLRGLRIVTRLLLLLR